MSVIDFWQRKKIKEVVLNDIPFNISSDSAEDDTISLEMEELEEEKKINLKSISSTESLRKIELL